MDIFIKHIKSTLFCFSLLTIPVISVSQSQKDLRINEILPVNETGITNSKGNKTPWIEIFNSAYNNVNLGGLYITDDRSNLTKHLIPKGNPITVMPQRSFLLLHADGDISQGVLHLSFNISESGFLALVEPNGRRIIDSISFPKLQADVSLAREYDGGATWKTTAAVSPETTNHDEPALTTGELFIQHDPIGIGMAIIAMTVVFLSLILLYLVFKNTAKLFSLDLKKARLLKKGKVKEAEALKEDTSGEVMAAIAMAIHSYAGELHDEENAVLTIRRVSKTYSPWSSKIYGLRQFNKKIW